MKTILLTFLTALIALSTSGQTDKNFNLNFELTDSIRPIGWNVFGSANYAVGLDTVNKQNGKYAVSIEYKEGASDFKAWAFTIPNNYPGKKITLTGYIKTENVKEGYAGLWMRIDPSVAFDNMHNRGAKGTSDWTKYEVTLDLNPAKTKQIVVGGLLVGKGKMWLDNLSISIDGKDIKGLKTLEKKIYLAEQDSAFNKGSGISLSSVDAMQRQHLKYLGLIWGFLKYYHPAIATGNYQWDYELFRVLPKVLAAQNNQERDEVLTKWILALGAFEPGKEIKVKASEVKLLPDLQWITDAQFSTELTNLLLKVKQAKRPKEHYYIDFYPGVGNPEFKNEKSYPDIKYPDAGFRLLTLFRYWNIIHYFFPYKNLIEEDWKMVLEEFIPTFLAAKDETAYTLTTLKLIGRIHDTHANIWGENEALNQYFGLRYAAVELTFIENKAVVTGFYDDALGKETGLQVGDVITRVSNQSVEEYIKEKLDLFPASNYPTKLRDIAISLLRTNDSLLPIEYFRSNQKVQTVLATYPSKEFKLYRKYMPTDTSFKMIDQQIAYLNNSTLKSAHLPLLWPSIQTTKGLIIDARNYPSDFPIYDLSNYLMPKRIPFVKFSNGSLESPGLFTYTPSLTAGKRNKQYYKGKVVILVNEISQSSAEFHSMAYRVHPRAVVLGSTTAGADGNVSRFVLPGGIITMISGIGVYDPNGAETQRIGIVPTIPFTPTIQGIQAGKDELIEKAIEIIGGK
jgi:C-terminal processing protease CtpA/Prc